MAYQLSRRFLGVGATVSFEITAFASPDSILPLPPGAYGVLSPPLSPQLQSIPLIPERIRPKIFENQQRCLDRSTNYPSNSASNSANAYTFLIWEPWGALC